MSDTKTETEFVLEADDLIQTFTQFLQFDVANGAASGETISAYWIHVKYYLNWCVQKHVQPRDADRNTIKLYRYDLIQHGYGSKTMDLKLSSVRRFYDAAIEYGVLIYNPAMRINAPINPVDRTESITYLNQDEANKLLGSIDNPHQLKLLRDRLMLGLMTLEGVRTIELHRANIGDIVRIGEDVGLKLNGKRRIRTVPLTSELAVLLDLYLAIRVEEGYEAHLDSPLFISLVRWANGDRLTRRGMRYLVDYYLKRVDLKDMPSRKISAHSLRHTAGTLAVQNGASLRQVQDLLGHADLRTTALYIHVGDKWKNNPALKSGVNLYGNQNQEITDGEMTIDS